MKQIIIDDREPKFGNIKDRMDRKKIPIIYKRLPLFDYVIASNFKEDLNATYLVMEGGEIESSGIIVHCAFERKEAHDFYSSLISDRLNDQLYRMSTSFPHSYLILEGNLWDVCYERNFSYNTILSALSRSFLKRSPDGQQGTINLIMSMNDEDTGKWLYAIYKNTSNALDQWRLPRVVVGKTGSSHDAKANALLQSAYGIGEGLSIKLLEHFGSVKAVVNASTMDFMKVKGIGEGDESKAHELYQLFNKNYSVRKDHTKKKFL